MLGNSRLDQIGADVPQPFVTRISPKVARKTLADASVFTAKKSISAAFAAQAVGIKEVEEAIWLVSFVITILATSIWRKEL
jgi:hypothetical protein